MKTIKRALFYPFLFAIFPVLSLLGGNIRFETPLDAIRSGLISLLFTALLLGMGRVVFRDWYRAGLLTTVILILFFSYGHVFQLVNGAKLFGFEIGRHRFLILLWILIFVSVSTILLKMVRNPKALTPALNVIGLVLIVFPIYEIAAYNAEVAISRSQNTHQTALSAAQNFASQIKPIPGTVYPDIYYIILDAYTRDDTLQNYLKFDNRPFLNQLTQMGFYVGRCSQSNYGMTELSLSSSLNMDYLDHLGSDLADLKNHIQLVQLLQSNAVRKNLRQAGYRIINFESGFSSTEWSDADQFLTPNSEFFANYISGGINPFEALLIKTSAGLIVYDSSVNSDSNSWLHTALDGAYNRHRRRILYSLSELEKMPQFPGPKFVFVHILAPHEPFVFGPNGEVLIRRTPFTLNGDQEYASGDLYIQGYLSQVQFLNQRVAQVVQTLLTSSKTAPIIIIQGDHGVTPRVSSPNARMTIFNAYYFPGGPGADLYPGISPVNSFRVIFNRFLGTNYPLLKDVSYYSSYDTPNQFEIESNLRPGCSEVK